MPRCCASARTAFSAEAASTLASVEFGGGSLASTCLSSFSAFPGW